MKSATITLLTILSIFTADTAGQDNTFIHGIVTDGHRNRLVGINVIIKGTPTGAATDLCGRFSVPFNSDELTLFFHGMSYDDMRTYEIKLTKTEVTRDTLVFQLGHWEVQNPNCDKVTKKLRRKVME